MNTVHVHVHNVRRYFGISVYRFFTIFEFADIDGMAIEKISLYRLSLIFCFFPIFTIIISIKSRHPIVHRTPYTLDALPCVLRYTTTRLGNGENPKYKMTSSLISQDARRKLTRACFGRLAIYRILTIYFQRYINTENLLYRRTLEGRKGERGEEGRGGGERKWRRTVKNLHCHKKIT